MKIAELETAIREGTEVAVAITVEDGVPYGVSRAIVKAVRVERRVFSGERWDISGHDAKDGVRVEYLDKSPRQRRDVVGPRMIVSTWADELARQAKAEEREAQKKQRQDSLNDQLRDLIPIAERHGMYDAADFLKGRVVR